MWQLKKELCSGVCLYLLVARSVQIRHGVTAPCQLGEQLDVPQTAADTRPLNSAAAKCRWCPLIPPAGIGSVRTLTLPDRRSAGAVRGEAAANGLRGYPSLGPRKPQSGEGHWLNILFYIDRLSGRRLAGPLAAPKERKHFKKRKKGVRKVQLNKPFALPESACFLQFSARWAAVIPSKAPEALKSEIG